MCSSNDLLPSPVPDDSESRVSLFSSVSDFLAPSKLIPRDSDPLNNPDRVLFRRGAFGRADTSSRSVAVFARSLAANRSANRFPASLEFDLTDDDDVSLGRGSTGVRFVDVAEMTWKPD